MNRVSVEFRPENLPECHYGVKGEQEVDLTEEAIPGLGQTGLHFIQLRPTARYLGLTVMAKEKGTSGFVFDPLEKPRLAKSIRSLAEKVPDMDYQGEHFALGVGETAVFGRIGGPQVVIRNCF